MGKFFQFIWFNIFKAMCAITFFTCYRIKVYGKENIPKGPVLLLSNHQSFLDPILCQIPVCRNFHFVARKTLFDGKFLGTMLHSINTMPIKQGEPDIPTMKKIIDLLKAGKIVCLFPEASRSADGKIADIKGGFSLLVRRSKATVVPTMIDGAFEAWPRQQKYPKLGGRISVYYGKPITAEDTKKLPDEEFARLLSDQLKQMQNEVREKSGKKLFDYSQTDNSQDK